jgi:hypothetical protein
MLKPLIVGVTLAALSLARFTAPLKARTADPTFAEDVAPVLYKNCTVCHHDGGMAPFSLVSYDTAVAHADEIRDAVAQRVMPPWHSTDPHGVFSNDRRLSDDDRNTILRWIDAGAKPGDLHNLPPKPEYPAGWTFGKPDLIVSMPEEYTVPASGTIEYQAFQVTVDIPVDRWVQAIEIMPGAREAVHHVQLYAASPVDPAAATAAPAAPVLITKKEYALPAPEVRKDTTHRPPQHAGALIASYVPGTNVNTFPKGTALRLRRGTVLTFSMHYTAHGHEMHDRTSVGFKFADHAPDEEIFAAYFVNGNFTIPAGAKDVPVPSEVGFGRAVRVWGLMPHTHLRGTRWEYTLVMPDSSPRVVLDVPHYDFNWQTYYMFAKPLEIPAGGKLTSMAWYDNSATNKHNPDPTTDVHWGSQTWEEMQYTGILYSVVGRQP